MSQRFDRALEFAVKAHAGQTRKSQSLPYILHPMEVAAAAASMTDSEDVLIAALLHDTVEDADVTPETIGAEFGERVAALVASETEPHYKGESWEETWKHRKTVSLDFLRDKADREMKILWLADKLANLRSLHRSWREQGDAAFNIFHQKDKKEQAWYYNSIAAYTAELVQTDAYAEYCRHLHDIFGKERENG